MRNTRSKYLLFDHGGVLDGSLTDKIPSSDDLLLFKIDDGLYQILENGVQIVNILHTLVSRYGYKIGFHSECKEDEQLRVLDALNEACAQKRLEFPKVSVMAVKDSECFQRIPSHSPVIIKDRRHGISVAGYDLELDRKACTRQALSHLLGINESGRGDHVIFDDGENIIKQAKIEGWRTFLINEKLSLLKALKQIFHQEEEASSSRQKEPISLIPRSASLRKESPVLGRDREYKNGQKEGFSRQREPIPLIPSFSFRQEDALLRRDREYKNGQKEGFSRQREPVRLIPSRSSLRQEDTLLRRDREFQNVQKEVLNRQREPISLLSNRQPLLQEDIIIQGGQSHYAQKTEFSRQKEPILTIPNRPSSSQQKDNLRDRLLQNVQKGELNRQREPISLIPSRPLLRQAATLPERDRDFQNVQKEEFNRQREPVPIIPDNPPLLQQKDILRRGFSAQYAQQTEFSRQREPSPNRPPLWQESIVRRDREFRNTHKPRLGGSSFSSGIFIGQNGKEWIGKSDVADEKLSEAMACKEKIAGNIYAYYGANVPRMEISRQRFTNTGLGEDEENDQYVIHIMSELLSNFKTYQQATGEHFRLRRPNPDQHVRCSDGHTLPERGLGHILAVAALINDVDVIGASGGNIGFQEETDENGLLYAKTVKIDPGEAFNMDLSLQGHRSIRVALPEERKGDSQLAFDDLPLGTQREFLMTLHEIVKTPEAAFGGFFAFRGAHAFILHYNETVESMNKFLVTRQKQLLKDYQNDLKRTELLYKEWAEKSKMALSPEDKARKQEANAVQEQLFFYIPVDVEKQNQRISLLDAIEPILREEGSNRVILIKGPAGAGKSLSLLHLEQLLLKKRRENKNEPMPIYVDLKRFNTETVEHSFNYILKEKYNLNPHDIQQKKIIVLMDGYDEISGGCQKNLYQCQRLDQWPKLKMLISCRSQYLTSDYRDWFTPSSRGEDLEEFELLPFSPDQINQYLKRYAETGRREYSLKEYQENIKSIPNLSALITNPFILRILVESLPELMKQVQNGKGVNRYSVYEAFMRSWFIKQERRLSQSFDLPDDWNAIKAFEDFSKTLALTLHIHQKVETEAQDAFWGPFFSSSAVDAIRARSGCPLQRVRDHCYSFIHKSFLEYFAAKAIVEEALKPVSVVRPSHIIQELSVIDFFEDILELSPEITQDLVKQIMKSRNNRDLGKSAANAITLLNAVRHSFSGMDLSQIQIPGAVLDYGFFDSVNFTEANLQGVSFKRSWLYYANFQKASMSGVLFGERPFLEFPEEVTACCYSHDGKWLAVAAWEEIFLLDHKSLNKVRSFKEERKITSLSFSPNNQVIASLTTNGTISLWEVNTGKQKQCLKGDFKHAKGISFSTNGQKLASGRENRIYLWEVNNGEAKHCLELKGHSDHVQSVSLCPNNKILASGSKDKTIRLWDVSTGKQKLCLEGHSESVRSVCFSPNGQILASGSNDKTIRLWDVSTGKQKLCLEGHSQKVKTVCFSPNSQILASGSGDFTIRLWEVNTGKQKQWLEGHFSRVNSLSFCPNGKILASSGSEVSTVHLWEVNTEKEKQYLQGHSQTVNSVNFSCNGQIFASGSEDGTIRVWEVNTGKDKLCLEEHSGGVNSVCLSPNGQILASGSEDKTVRLWDVSTGKQKLCLEGHSEHVKSVCFSPNGEIIASGGSDNTIRLWETNTGKQKQCLEGGIESVCFSPNGELLASVTSGDIINLWIVSTGKEKQYLPWHRFNGKCFSFSPNSQILAAGSEGGTICLWEVNTGKDKLCLEGGVESVRFSPNGQILASISYDTICLSEVESGISLFRLPTRLFLFTAIDWAKNSNEDLIVAGGNLILYFKLVWDKFNKVRLRLVRSFGYIGSLALYNVNLKDAQGLAVEQIKLLRQKKEQLRTLE